MIGAGSGDGRQMVERENRREMLPRHAVTTLLLEFFFFSSRCTLKERHGREMDSLDD